ncbi:histidinol dehydrogenase [Sporosarcina sp. Marseille-Q4063]|uniref:histidinol dehydrogenase n=1 Tax=Sporosarcina sp. Marseille-Q4063 TaxID=2810514 RepID=UPI001BAF3322|nr:histidinol dehydrogenase [Sporosarcina sp. Marseille-Q4063]QUW22861.1 histidinol dehydrogenase [Sporosarcina sp. Marseille-Q4063]
MKILTGEQYNAELEYSSTTSRNNEELDRTVLNIIEEVREKGDAALKEFTAKFDNVMLDDLLVSEEEIIEARTLVNGDFIRAIKKAHKNIKAFHEEQTEKSWFTTKESGILLGQKITPLASVGIYVPGGKATYPSTVLMNAIPAKIAGVKKIAVTTPAGKDGKINPHVLVAAAEVGIKTIYKVGGAQAIAALAYGTETVQKVAKIVGPGNAYVARAKKWVFGDVAIDMIAGPSEICVVADETAVPRFVAADLLSQAEHDEQATAVCITTSQSFTEELCEEVKKQTAILERKTIIEESIAENGRIVLVDSLNEAFDLVNKLAPEHLQLMVANPMEQMQFIDNAGAIFLGNHSPEALGDYIAGPNHTLPTSGTSTFSSPLGVYDFIKRSSIIHYSEKALLDVADDIITLANAEGLSAHANSIAIRKADK